MGHGNKFSIVNNSFIQFQFSLKINLFSVLSTVIFLTTEEHTGQQLYDNYTCHTIPLIRTVFSIVKASGGIHYNAIYNL